MREKNRKNYPVLLMAAVLIPIMAYASMAEPEQKKEKKLYSVILYQDMENEWIMLEAGAEQAKDDTDMMVNYVYLEPEADVDDEIRAIQKETDLGTSGILLAGVDSEKMQEKLTDAGITVPLVFVESGAGDAYPVIRADDYQMGVTLANAVLEKLDEKEQTESTTVLILGEQMVRDSVQLRYQGLMDTLTHSGKKILIQDETGKKTEDLTEILTEVQQEQGVVAALDKYTTEKAADLWEEYQSLSQKKKSMQPVYGIGNTAVTVNDLDNEKLSALVYQNEFSMGYQGMMALAEKRTADWIAKNISISYNMVTKETLCEEEHARLLFLNS